MKTPYPIFLVFPALLAAHNALLPQPREVRYGAGRLPLQGLSVVLASSRCPEDNFTLARLSQGLSKLGATPGVHRIRLIRTGPVDALPRDGEQPGPESREAYQLRVTPDGAELRARTSAGLFYGAETLLQMVEGSGRGTFLPDTEIHDWPSLAYRGVMYDLSHGPLPTEDEIKRQIDFLARWKGNQYYFYSELSIELKGYSIINPGGRYSQDQVRRIIEYARQRHVDVVPCLEFFGHLHDLFRIERYADLAVLPHGGDLNPRVPQIQHMLEDWIDQMTALFPSPWFHIGLDEPWELERATSSAAGVDPAKLYLDHLMRTSELVRRRGKRVLFWADVASGAHLFEKYPQLAGSLPQGILPVPWNYRVAKDYSMMLEPFQKARVPEIIATGIWAWETMAPNFQVTFSNIDGYVRDGRRYGTLGIINTNWADDAQILFRATEPGVAYGAIAGWQDAPIDRGRFWARYSAALYGDAAPDVAAAMESLSAAEQSMTAALGAEDMFRLWDDPFMPQVLSRARAHVSELRQARLDAEAAQEHLQAAVGRDPDSLSSLLFAARLLDYAGMKFLYAVEIADHYAALNASSTREDISFWLGTQTGSRNHSRISDLMDIITELRDLYQAQWDAEYTPYRRGSALGRFGAEYEYWRRMQARLWEMRRGLRPG
ncbi:MAG: glycoside hydrolase family 20 zincin-like fold domain-containing protein, partial [Bryobacteraceae bacterium]